MKRIIGLEGEKSDVAKVANIIASLKAATNIGDIEEIAQKSAVPRIDRVRRGYLEEHDIRNFASKVGVTMPSQKLAGKAVKTQADIDEYFGGLMKKYVKAGWESESFLDTDYYRRKDGVYVAGVRKQDSRIFSDRLNKDYLPVTVYRDASEKPRGLKFGINITDETTEDELKSRVVAALSDIKNYWKEIDRK